MSDNRLLADLSDTPIKPEAVDKLRTAGIATYTALYAALRDDTNEPALRIHVCRVIDYLQKQVDRRRAVPALLTAINTADVDLQIEAVRSLGYLRARRAVPRLTVLMADRSAADDVRIVTALTLGGIDDPRAADTLRAIAFDPTESLQVRAEVIEWTHWLIAPDVVDPLVKLLEDPAPDIRFWAAYALADLASPVQDITPALATLDRIVATDNAIPVFFGWQVDREALKPLEAIHFQPHRREDDHPVDTWLISPAWEYMRVAVLLRSQEDDGRYTTDRIPPVDPNWLVSAEWLREHLTARWPDIRFNARPNNLLAYQLDWAIDMEGYTLLGALHRDGYGIVLTGTQTAVFTFAVWYRGVASQRRLYLYEWGDFGYRLEPHTTVDELDYMANKPTGNTFADIVG